MYPLDTIQLQEISKSLHYFLVWFVGIDSMEIGGVGGGLLISIRFGTAKVEKTANSIFFLQNMGNGVRWGGVGVIG